MQREEFCKTLLEDDLISNIFNQIKEIFSQFKSQKVTKWILELDESYQNKNEMTKFVKYINDKLQIKNDNYNKNNESNYLEELKSDEEKILDNDNNNIIKTPVEEINKKIKRKKNKKIEEEKVNTNKIEENNEKEEMRFKDIDEILNYINDDTDSKKGKKKGKKAKKNKNKNNKEEKENQIVDNDNEANELLHNFEKEYASGSFKCPACGKNQMGKYIGWKSVKKHNDNQIPTWYWIFYTDKEKEYIFPNIKSCYFCCKKDTFLDESHEDCPCCICNLFAFIWGIIITLIWLALYITIIVWCDIYNACSKETMMYKGIFGKKKKKNVKEYLSNEEIWEYYDGYEEDYINNNVEKKCLNCNKIEDSFLKFAEGHKTDIKFDDIDKINIKIDDIDENNPISLMFSTLDNAQISRSIICYPKDKFSDAVKKIYEEYPQHKNKPKYYISNGKQIEENKTIEQNKFKDGDKVIIKFVEEEEDPKVEPKREPLIEN